MVLPVKPYVKNQKDMAPIPRQPKCGKGCGGRAGTAMGRKLRVGSGRHIGNGLKIRVETVNVGSMNGSSGEVVEMVWKGLDFCSLPETRRKGECQNCG
jgi:hypothetical protein